MNSLQRLCAAIAYKTDLDTADLAKEVVTNMFEDRDELIEFIGEILKYRDNPKVLCAIVTAHLDMKIEDEINDAESLCMDDSAADFRDAFDRTEAQAHNRANGL